MIVKYMGTKGPRLSWLMLVSFPVGFSYDLKSTTIPVCACSLIYASVNDERGCCSSEGYCCSCRSQCDSEV